MALMEKPAAGKLLLDDTVPLTAVIETSQNLQSHTVIRRYSDFDMLNNSLLISGLNLPLPPKKLIGNMDREFIAERQKGLQSYLNFLTQHHILSSCELIKKFLDINNYSANYTEIALQQVSMFFRSDLIWEVVEPLKDIGWRIRKRYFLVKNKEQPKERQVLSWVDFGPDKFLSDKDLQSVMKLLPSLSVKPKEAFLKKYCNPKKIQGLELQQIRTYGRQILEALKFLHDKGFPYGHLHASNVVIEDNTCKLLDIENSTLGLPSYYRPYVTQFRKINTTDSVDVYSFGHLLYEMTYGRPPDVVPVDQYPSVAYTSVVSVLQSILSTEACKTGMPTVPQLLQTPLFSDVLLFNTEKAQFKVTSKLKEALKLSKECLEKRLQEEQRAVQQHRRLTRAQSHHGSEEEKRKRKILARKKSRQSTCENEEDFSVKYNNNSGSGTSSPPTCPSSPTPPPAPGIQPVTLPPPPPPPPPPLGIDPSPPSLQPPSANDKGRVALLSSIQTFSKGRLKKAETKDRSNPHI
ncbi:PX domain-containing protein kinase-like protein [Bagarius yarrelli]|uniref:PX domain-containing protein kinase-like protein n=1 Tax=Bagarius yarrelli TaxID=175774 RepID=A0A556U3T9_BAGYA|nr:PX domain-containing protein kinase-like protein [Bagarius yarrelli]